MKKIKIIMIIFLICLIICFAFIYRFYQKQKNDIPEFDSNTLTISEAVESIHVLYDITNYIQIKKIEKNKKDILDKHSAKQIFNQLQITQSQKKELMQSLEHEVITREEWGTILILLGEFIGIGEVCQRIETAVFYQDKKDASIVTNDGRFVYAKQSDYQDMSMIDNTLHAVSREHTILFIISVENQADFQNVLIKECNEQSIIGSLFGQEREIECKREIDYKNELSQYTFADMVLNQGELQELYFKQTDITGKILSVSENTIELEGYGVLPLSPFFRVLSSETFETKSIEKLIVGNANITYVVGNGEVCGAFIKEDSQKGNVPDVSNIRVMLMSSGFRDSFHDVVTITCSGDFNLCFFEKQQGTEITNRTEILHPYQAGETVALTPENEILSYSRIRITPVNQNDRLKITSLKRNGNHPTYRGSIEISVYQGRLVLVNEVSVEEYLYSVVPSEMPSSYGVEALKVQAVCARSYAVSHMTASKLSKYGAHVDDSVNYQVYNNTQETENSIAAVDATKGMVLTYNNTVIHAYFYATCCGSTADGTVWSNQQIPYIESKYLGEGEIPDLMNNDVFTEFIKSKPDTYDDTSPWYRWQVTLSMETITNGVNHMLYSLYCSNKHQILTLGANGNFESKPIHSVGTVQSVSVTKRGQGGIIEELLIKGTQAQVLILKQGNIRKIINPYGNEMIRNDGSTIDTMSALPSAFFAIEAGKDKNSLQFYGGGYGHGAGMSQTAVRELVEAGKPYEEILQFFYPGTVLSGQS